jgi:uncharacterized protein (TIGR02246 family)
MSDARSLYDGLLDAWNRQNAEQFARLFEDDAVVIGFDGSLMIGRDAILEELGRIFADHPTARYVAKVREVRVLADGVVLLRAVVGMVPPGASDINPTTNAHQTLIARGGTGEWRIAHFQNTPAQFHGRPELAEALTDELRKELVRT